MQFFPILYDNFISNEDLANDLFDSNTYSSVGMIMIITTVIWMPIYYYIISNYGKLYKVSVWAIWILIIAIINFSVANYNAGIQLDILYKDTEHGSPYTALDLFSFSIINFIWTIVFSFIISIPLKLKSIQASKTPF